MHIALIMNGIISGRQAPEPGSGKVFRERGISILSGFYSWWAVGCGLWAVL